MHPVTNGNDLESAVGAEGAENSRGYPRGKRGGSVLGGRFNANRDYLEQIVAYKAF